MYLVKINGRDFRLSAEELEKLQAKSGVHTHICVLDYCKP